MLRNEYHLQITSDLELGEVDETLKWGEPSYSVKTGSPLPETAIKFCLELALTYQQRKHLSRLGA